jgi:branched-chain amino acid transport system permease protein
MAEASAPHRDLARALRDAGFAALLSFGLLLPLIGFNTVQNIRNELVLETRWPLLFTLVGVIAVGRFLQSFAISPWLERRARAAR